MTWISAKDFGPSPMTLFGFHATQMADMASNPTVSVVMDNSCLDVEYFDSDS